MQTTFPIARSIAGVSFILIALGVCLPQAAQAEAASTVQVAEAREQRQIATLALTLRDRTSERSRSVQIDLSQARLIDVKALDKGLTPDSVARLTDLGRALSSGATRRFVMIGSNDSASPAGRAGSAGFRNARAALAALAAGGLSGERVIVAGWQAKAGDPGILSRLDSGGYVLVAPVVESVRVIAPQVGGDAGRTLALDSAAAMLTLASSGAGGAPLAITPPVAAAPMPILPPAPRVAPAPVPAPAPVASLPPPRLEPVAPPPAVLERPAFKEPTPPAQVLSGSAEGCAKPAFILDDFYPGGPFRDCQGRRRMAVR